MYSKYGLSRKETSVSNTLWIRRALAQVRVDFSFRKTLALSVSSQMLTAVSFSQKSRVLFGGVSFTDHFFSWTLSIHIFLTPSESETRHVYKHFLATMPISSPGSVCGSESFFKSQLLESILPEFLHSPLVQRYFL